MKIKLILLYVLFLPTLKAIDCSRNPIYCHIVKLSPLIDRTKAMQLSNTIYKEAKTINLDPMISVAILMQESSFKHVNTYKKTESTEEYCSDSYCTKNITIIATVVDLGIAQINVRTAVDYKLDLNMLYNRNTEYALKAHFTILKDKVNQCKHLGEEAWSCYHSFTEEHRLRYLELVRKYLP